MREPDEKDRALAALREAISTREPSLVRHGLDVLAKAGDERSTSKVTPLEAVDLLERACTYGPRASAQAVWEYFQGNFVYTGWALALALRCANEDVARWLLGLGVDLLGAVRQPKALRALLPHEGSFTRFDLVRESPTLFLNNMDHTVSTEVFDNFSGTEQIIGKPYAVPTSLRASCELVGTLASEGLFDAVVFDDLFRACVVKAWHALRHARDRDPKTAQTCLALAKHLLKLHRERDLGDGNVRLIMGNLIVPKADPDIMAFVCLEMPDVFLGRLRALSWLQEDTELIRRMVPALSPATEQDNAALLLVLARSGLMEELKAIASWPDTFTTANLPAAVEAASVAGHAEVATWLLARLEAVREADGAVPAATSVRLGDATAAIPTHRQPGKPATGGTEQEALPPAGTKGKDTSRPASAVPTDGDREAAGTVALDRAGVNPAAAVERSADGAAQLAIQIVELARSEIVSQNPFLAGPFSLLTLAPTRGATSALAVDGQTLSFNVDQLIQDFVTRRAAPAHDMAHVLVHCLLLHPFVGATVGREAWSLAADVAAEKVVCELLGPREGERGRQQRAAFDHLCGELHGEITAERLYRALAGGAYAPMRNEWAELFGADDHAGWYPSDGETHPGDVGHDQQGTSDDAGTTAQSSRTQSHAGWGDDRPKTCESGPSDHQGSPAKDDRAVNDRASGGATDASADTSASPAQPSPPEVVAQKESDSKGRWLRAAKSMRIDLETLSRRYGTKAQSFVKMLNVSAHEQIDYREFLRQFAVSGEQLRLSDSEFDYIFYTYGLELYKDTPLIEPLEYRDERRIRDFAIVIDTSSSITPKVVQQFVNTTFDVLTSESSFFERTNIHIIQADAQVQSDTTISSLAELDHWRRNIRLRGFGGTDFRPAFRHVRKLMENGEFDDLRGLIYFTDGWGIYPERMPPYKTTFVFYDEDHRPELVPAWAMQITLHPGEFESMSVY